MWVFITGATGLIGSAIVRCFVAAGHEVTDLVRSTDAAVSLEASGAQACRGTIEDLDVLCRSATKVDYVIHTAFFHALSQTSLGIRVRIMFGGRSLNIVERFATEPVGAERRAIEAFAGALEARTGSLILAFPTMGMTPGRPALETDAADPGAAGALRGQSEKAALDLSRSSVNATVVRLSPSVHDGTELALESGEAGARDHAVAEEGIAFRAIAEVIGCHLDVLIVPLSDKDAAGHFGWLAPFVNTDNPVSSQATREQLGWEPRRPQLMTNLTASLLDVRR